MNANLLFPTPERVIEKPPFPKRHETAVATARFTWDAGSFAEEQIRRLVRQVFFPGWPKPARYVVFAAIEDDVELAGTCLRIGEVLAGYVEGRIAVIETMLKDAEFEEAYGVKGKDIAAGKNGFGSLHSGAYQVSDRLWLVPPTQLCDKQEGGSCSLGSAVNQIRQEFDYAVLHAPPVGLGGDALELGHLCDGVVMVLKANASRRAAAQKAKEMLQMANARVLGAVLSERTFPIPEGIYRRL